MLQKLETESSLLSLTPSRRLHPTIIVYPYSDVKCTRCYSSPCFPTWQQTYPYQVTTLQHLKTPYNTSQHLTTPHNTSQHLTTPHNTSQHLTTPHNTSQRLTTPHNTSKHLTTPHNTSQHLTTPHNTLQHLTSPHNSSKHLTMPHTPHNTSHHLTTPHNTSQHLTTPHNTSQHLTTPHNISQSPLDHTQVCATIITECSATSSCFSIYTNYTLHCHPIYSVSTNFLSHSSVFLTPPPPSLAPPFTIGTKRVNW